MKSENWHCLLLLFCSLQMSDLKGQQVSQLLYSFPVPEQLDVSSDGQGNIILSTPDGEIQKFSAEGELLNIFSPQSASYFNSIDARFSMQVRVFDENSQQLIYLDRFLNQTGSTELPPEHFNFISALGWSSSGNSIWVYDASDMQLKMWRTDTRETGSALKIAQLISSPFEVRILHEHQHKLYLLGTDRLLVFGLNGSFEKELALPEWRSVAFSGEKLFCLTAENTIELIPLHKAGREKLLFATENNYQKVLAANKKLYLFTEKQVDVFSMTTP